MNRTTIQFSALFFILLLFSPLAISCDLTVRLEEYSAQSQKIGETWQGLDVELADLLLSTAECSYTFTPIPWGRSLRMLESGEVDMMLTVSKTDQRKDFIQYIGPQRTETIVFTSLPANTPNGTQVSSFDALFSLPKPFAIQRGAFYGPMFDEMFSSDKANKHKVIVVADNQHKIDLLVNRRISGFLEAKLNVYFERQQEPALSELQIHPLVINRANVYYAFSKKSVPANVLLRIQRAYESLQRDDKFTPILEKYSVN